MEGVAIDEVEANGYRFRCYSCGDGSAGHVLLLHGFPYWAKMYVPMMKLLSAKGFKCVAYDQRGYSVGARPDDKSEFHYDKLVDDIFAVADAVGFPKFHLVAHDHGAVLGWYANGWPRGRERFLSYAAISIPHADCFAAAMYGGDADTEQQRASQYFITYQKEGLATANDGEFYKKFGGPKLGFDTAEDFQRSIWWYWGALQAGIFALPPTYDQEAGKFIEGTGTAQTSHVGNIDIPVVYAAGSRDTYIKCTAPFAKRTSEFCRGGYKYVEAPTGHSLNPPGEDNQAWYDAIEALICGTLEFDKPAHPFARSSA